MNEKLQLNYLEYGLYFGVKIVTDKNILRGAK